MDVYLWLFEKITNAVERNKTTIRFSLDLSETFVTINNIGTYIVLRGYSHERKSVLAVCAEVAYIDFVFYV